MLDVAGVTVPVKDMRRGLEFYAHLLDRRPVLEDASYSVFDVAGTQLGLLASVAAEERPQPLLRTHTLDRERERIRRFASEVGEIREHNNHRLFLLTDPDGHTVEVYEAR